MNIQFNPYIFPTPADYPPLYEFETEWVFVTVDRHLEQIEQERGRQLMERRYAYQQDLMSLHENYCQNVADTNQCYYQQVADIHQYIAERMAEKSYEKAHR